MGISLLEQNLVGVFGVEEHRERILDGILSDITILHSPDLVKLVLLFSDSATAQRFGYACDLPHLWDDSKALRYLAAGSDSVCIEVMQEMIEYHAALRTSRVVVISVSLDNSANE